MIQFVNYMWDTSVVYKVLNRLLSYIHPVT